jgi:hypothetical protein
LPNAYYNCNIKQVHLALADGLFSVDSILIVPELGKRAFMRKTGRQTDRISGLISSFAIEGFQVSGDTTLRFFANRVSTNFYLEIFRDKRYPFIKDF